MISLLLANVALAAEPMLPPSSFIAVMPIVYGQAEEVSGQERMELSNIGAGLSTAFSFLGLIQTMRDKRFGLVDYSHMEAVVLGRWQRVRLEAGFGGLWHEEQAWHDEDLDVWLRIGGFTGSRDQSSGRIDTLGGGVGWRVAAGARVGPLSVEVSPAVGAQYRSQQARIFVAPFQYKPYMIGIDVDHMVVRDPGTREHGTRLGLCVGVL